MENKKPFSETLRILLKFSKEYNGTINIKSLQECLGKIYHPDMRLKDIIVVLDVTLREALSIKELEMPNRDCTYLNIITSPITGINSLGNILTGPYLDDKFTIEEFYNKILSEYIHKLMFTNVGWCREYIFGKEEKKMSEVRTFKIGDYLYTLEIDLSDDHTEVFKSGESIGLKFDSSTNVIYNDRKIGKLRYSYPDEEPKNIKFKLNVKEDIIDTGVNDKLVESFLDAEVFVTKYLIDNGLINS